MLGLYDDAVSAAQVQHLRTVLDRAGPSAQSATVIYKRLGPDDPQRARDVAQLLRDHSPRVIVALTLAIARTVQIIDPRTPIVFDGAADPVKICLVDALVKPGRNATGFTTDVSAEAKMLEVLLDAYARLKRVVVLVDGNEWQPIACDTDTETPPRRACEARRWRTAAELVGFMPTADLQAAARRRGVTLSYLEVCSAKDFSLIERLARQRTDVGFVVPMHFLFQSERAALVKALTGTSAPAIYPRRYFIDAGALMALSPVRDAAPQAQAFDITARILAGARPADIPVELPAGFALHINLRAIDSEALRPSLSALRRADHIVR